MSGQLYCPIRRLAVTATPEELVRQRLLHDMTEQLGYPLGHLAVEKKLCHIPHVAHAKALHKQIPSRRADIIFFGKDIHPDYELYPLLLVECKATKLSKRAISQVIGYNYYLKAYFIAIANEESIYVGWHDIHAKQYRFTDSLPTCQELITAAKNLRKGV